MSKVTFLDPIDHVSGKLSKNSRVTYCFRPASMSEHGEERKYTQIRGKRSTPYTAAELARFDKFSAVAKAVAARNSATTCGTANGQTTKVNERTSASAGVFSLYSMSGDASGKPTPSYKEILRSAAIDRSERQRTPFKGEREKSVNQKSNYKKMFIEPPCKAEKESHESIIGGALARTKGHEKKRRSTVNVLRLRRCNPKAMIYFSDTLLPVASYFSPLRRM